MTQPDQSSFLQGQTCFDVPGKIFTSGSSSAAVGAGGVMSSDDSNGMKRFFSVLFPFESPAWNSGMFILLTITRFA